MDPAPGVFPPPPPPPLVDHSPAPGRPADPFPTLNKPVSLDWAWLVRGGHVLYVASAACILIGIAQIIIPAYKERALAAASLQGWGTLNIYELALLAAALALVLWRRVWDDAVSLTLLAVAFLVGTSITLDTVGPAKPYLALGLGVLGLALAAGKLAALARWVTARVNAWAIAGAGVLLAWNFLIPGVLGWKLAHAPLDDNVRPLWLAGWWIGLLGGALLLAGAWRLPDHVRPAKGSPRPPFLRTPAMSWLCLTLLLAATFTHQYALLYVTVSGVPPVGDFLPALGLLVLVLLEAARAHGWATKGERVALALLPLGVAAVVLGAGAYRSRWGLHADLVNYPPMFLIEMALVLGALAWRRRWIGLGVTAGVYMLVGGSFVYKDLTANRPGGGPWLWVLAAFALLGLGFLASVYKSRMPARA
jgi:hypothetical protein